LCPYPSNANNISNMTLDAARLGEVEQLVLLAVLKLDGEAYAVPIRALIDRDAGVKLSRGSIYITLDRLQRKGLVESWFSDPTGEPGGKARRLFRIRSAGVAALKAARRAVERLSAGTALGKR
jgi:PadR family transcriptional regulator PadR